MAKGDFVRKGELNTLLRDLLREIVETELGAEIRRLERHAKDMKLRAQGAEAAVEELREEVRLLRDGMTLQERLDDMQRQLALLESASLELKA